jgi:hypothetical protein
MFVFGEPEILRPPARLGLGAATYTDAQVAQALRESMAQGFSLLDSISGAIRVFGVPVEQAYRAGDIVAAEINPGGFMIISKQAPPGYDYSAAQILSQRERDINNLYREILNRDAEAEGLQFWRDSDLSIPEIEAQIRQIAREIGVTARTEPVVDVFRETYTDAQVAQALRESIAQGFSLLDSISGAIRVFGVPVEQAYRAGDIVAAEIQAAQAARAAAASESAARLAADAAAKAAADAAAKAAADAAARAEAARKAAADAAAAAAKAAADAAAKAAADAAAKAASDAAARATEAARKAAADAAAKAAADAAAKTALTMKPTGTRAFTDAEIAQAMRESLKQGFSLKDSVTGAVTKFSVPQDQAIRVAQQVAAETQPTTAPVQAGIGPLLLAVAAAFILGA